MRCYKPKLQSQTKLYEIFGEIKFNGQNMTKIVDGNPFVKNIQEDFTYFSDVKSFKKDFHFISPKSP